MRKTLVIFVLVALGSAVWSTAAAKPVGYTTINLRACIDAGDGACQSETQDIAIDGASVCFGRTEP
jgi:hypothetical protein